MSAEEQPDLRLGPDPNVTYPIQVQYCGNCSLPIEVRQHQTIDISNLCCMTVCKYLESLNIMITIYVTVL